MGAPKPLLDCGGETFLDRLIGVFSTSCRPVIAVLGHHARTFAPAPGVPPKSLS
jgi:CTP:molybdopterin cytidylyltransferase MocA